MGSERKSLSFFFFFISCLVCFDLCCSASSSTSCSLLAAFAFFYSILFFFLRAALTCSDSSAVTTHVVVDLRKEKKSPVARQVVSCWCSHCSHELPVPCWGRGLKWKKCGVTGALRCKLMIKQVDRTVIRASAWRLGFWNCDRKMLRAAAASSKGL